MFRLDNCSALITGASAGIGREFARQLAPRAGSLLLVARRQNRLEQLRAELLTINPALRVDVRTVDLANEREMTDLAQSLAAEPIDLLINNAGLGDRGDFATADYPRLHQQVQVNILALSVLTRAVLPGMLARKLGAILNVSSTAAFLPLPGYAVYAATKAYVNSFSQAIRVETRRCGIHITALCPGPVHTEFEEVATRAARPLRSAPEFTHVPVEDVVHAALRAIVRNKPIVIPGLVMKLGMGMTRLLPLPLLRFASRVADERDQA
ncbi:MAG: SDR family oxidoreductase [Verrucomicrobia bacterium]|nr:SDR family oxidoreductase [Verrucomicrobiota bacterium]